MPQSEKIYFLLIRMTITTMTITIATTKKMPKPIPALKIPVTTLHELPNKKIISKVIKVINFEFFIEYDFKFPVLTICENNR